MSSVIVFLITCESLDPSFHLSVVILYGSSLEWVLLLSGCVSLLGMHASASRCANSTNGPLLIEALVFRSICWYSMDHWSGIECICGCSSPCRTPIRCSKCIDHPRHRGVGRVSPRISIQLANMLPQTLPPSMRSWRPCWNNVEM